jgi:hypothetical protein
VVIRKRFARPTGGVADADNAPTNTSRNNSHCIRVHTARSSLERPERSEGPAATPCWQANAMGKDNHGFQGL